MRQLEFGWYLPTHGDTTAYGLPEAQVAGSAELCERVVGAAEAAGYEITSRRTPFANGKPRAM